MMLSLGCHSNCTLLVRANEIKIIDYVVVGRSGATDASRWDSRQILMSILALNRPNLIEVVHTGSKVTVRSRDILVFLWRGDQ